MASRWLTPLEDWFKLKVFPPAGAAIIRAGAQKQLIASRGLFLWGPPLWVPSDADTTELEAKRLELERRVNRVTAQADEAVTRMS